MARALRAITCHYYIYTVPIELLSPYIRFDLASHKQVYISNQPRNTKEVTEGHGTNPEADPYLPSADTLFELYILPR
jgi:hypothetical protein